MAAPTKRAWKLQEFVAHGGKVNCLALGHKSGRVMVTGGDDKKVNMWAVGKPNCIMSLSGHTSPVEAVRFGNAEEIVIAGSMSGALKIWDLEVARIVRTLTGHKSSIRSLDFHPYGDFVASGSLDTNIKLWDIRRKGCIYTYKSHTNCVNSLRFSPDGRWIASAGEDGLVKIWDLTVGKLLHDLKQHSGPVNSVEFHPNEFLLASGSSDRTVKFWDLETLKIVGSTEEESSPVRQVFFHPEGNCIYSSSNDSLKVYGWEPVCQYDSLLVGWNQVSDISIAQNQLIGGSFSQNNVSTYVVDIQRVQPLGGPPSPAVTVQPSQPHLTSSGRRNFHNDRPPTQSTKQTPALPKEEPEEADEPCTTPDDPGDDAASTADIKDPEDYREIFQPRHKLGNDRDLPPNPTQSPAKKMEPFPAPIDDDKEKAKMQPTRQERPTQDKPNSAGRERQAAAQGERQSAARGDRQPAGHGDRQPSAAPVKEKQQTIVPAHLNKPAGLDVDDFLPKQATPALNEQQTPPDMSEAEVLSAILKGHDSMVSVLSSRQKNLQIVRALWTGGNTRTAVDSAIGMNDMAIIVDLLNVLTQNKGLWNLDLCSVLLPQIHKLLDSKYENYIHCGCSALKLMLRNFASVIKANVMAPPSLGVDISREERYSKCKTCYGQLMKIRSLLESKQHGKLAPTFRELHLLMGGLD